ncbi:unnamed protein product [marine sediment metagenome]|uniref:Uncharacterized protein n=1 Tax=marine sediment metagenome TaxID=412755 RepID=X1VU64_9ZZZZ
MTDYRNRTTGDVLTEREVRQAHKNTSFSKVVDTFNDLGYDPIVITQRPALSYKYRLHH